MNKRTLTLKIPVVQGTKLDEIVARKCENCRFYYDEESHCRQRAPYIKTDTFVGIWPTVMPWDWCGQFKRLPLEAGDGQ